MRLNDNGEEQTEQGPGFTTKFLVDRQRQTEDDRDEFISYLSTSSLCIESWNAESLIYLGASYVPLQSLLRGGKEAVQCTVQCPVVFSALPGQAARVTTLLYLRLANIGHPSSNQIDLLHSRTPCVVSRRLQTLGDEGPDSYRIRAKPLNPAHDNMLQKFLHAQRVDINQRYEEMFDEESYDRIRQWEKLKHGIIPTQQKMAVNKFLFEEELEAYRKLRNQSKASKLLEAVFRGITLRHHIFPSLGEKAFFEYLLQNTYSEPVNCVVEMDEPGLSIVTDVDEWSYYKRANSLGTPIEKNLVLRNGGQLEIFLKPMEAVYVPFLYDNLKATKQLDGQVTSTKVLFRRWDNRSAISILDLRVEHRPYALNETYRFFNEAASNCERVIKVQGIPSDRRVGSVRCVDQSAKVFLQNRGVDQEVSITAFAGEPTSIRILIVLLYGDRYGYRLLSTWRILIHSLQRIDLHSTMGQSIKVPITLKSLETSNQLVQVFSSSPCLRSVSSQPFLITKEIQQLMVQYTPDYAGRRLHVITAVDVSSRLLLNAWLAYAKAEEPNISKVYDIRIPIKEESIIAKKLPVTNPYSIPRTFRLTSSRSDIVEIGDEVLQIPGLGSVTTTLLFHNVIRSPIQMEVMIFVFNGDTGQQEETIKLIVSYTE
ncbi:hypothetical protein GCK32_002051 [Trichostrongylus colubriformis]|uniref:Nephrocystin-4 n=1 Tax=Trichostrongylus colubriformis TaxID=6319 RepID=A0AAN8IFZ2_TRICO